MGAKRHWPQHPARWRITASAFALRATADKVVSNQSKLIYVVFSSTTVGADVIWEGDHPNRYRQGNTHDEYNNGSGRAIVERYFAEKNITPANQLNVEQAYEVINRLEKVDFNRQVMDYVAQQRLSGRTNVRGVIRGSLSQATE